MSHIVGQGSKGSIQLFGLHGLVPAFMPELPIELNDTSITDYLFHGITNFRKFPDPLPGTEEPKKANIDIKLRDLWSIK